MFAEPTTVIRAFVTRGNARYPGPMGLRALMAGLAVAVAAVVSGCGSSSGSPSPLDPAQIAPAKALAFIELTVRPQGSTRSGAETGLTKLLGHKPDADIQHAVGSLFKNSGLSYGSDVQPWLGQRIGVVFTAFSKSGLGLIAPTSNPSAALTALRKAEKKAALTSQKYRGLAYQQGLDAGSPIALGIVGHDAVIASPATFQRIVDASQGAGSLLRQPAFTSAFASLPSSSLVRAYANGPAAVSALESLPSLSPAQRKELRTALARSKVPSALTLALSVSSSSMAAEVHSVGTTIAVKRSTADVSHLSGQSWLALSTGSGIPKAFTSGFESGFMRGFQSSALAQGISPSRLLNLLQQRIGINLQRDLFPALGGFELSVQGSSLLTFGAGLALHPGDPAAGARLVADIRALVARGHSLQVSGGPRSFTLTKPGLPIPRIVVADTGRQILATLDEPSFQSLLAPATTLASNPAFQRARAQLIPGSLMPLFVDFGPVATLLGQTPQFKSDPTDVRVLGVLRRLDYLVFGFNQAASDAQLVLGLR